MAWQKNEKPPSYNEENNKEADSDQSDSSSSADLFSEKEPPGDVISAFQSSSDTDIDADISEEKSTEETELQSFSRPEKKTKTGGGESSFNIGIVGGQSTGKTVFLYVLGLLKVKNKTLNGWHIGHFSEEYSRFFGKVDDAEAQKNWQRTEFDDLDIFNLFSVAKGRLEVNIKAFDAAGENFEAAIDPSLVERENIPIKSERYRLIQTLRQEIISCDAFIFLIDTELSNPEFEEELLGIKANALLPDRLLLHLINLLKKELKVKTKNKIKTPIAFTLTKADAAQHNDDDFSKRIFELINNSKRSPQTVQKNSEDFIEKHFNDFFNLTDDFSNKSFHAISCIGHEPLFYFNPDPNDPNKREYVLRDEIKQYNDEGHQIKVWINEINPVYIEEPVITILEKVKEIKARHRTRSLTRKALLMLVVALFFAGYPFLTFALGKYAQKSSQLNFASVCYFLSKSHPLFQKNESLYQELIEKYFVLVHSFYSEKSLDNAFNNMKRLTNIVIFEKASQPVINNKNKIAAVESWLEISQGYIQARNVNKAKQSLINSMEIDAEDSTTKSLRTMAIVNLAELYSNENDLPGAFDLLKPLFIGYIDAKYSEQGLKKIVQKKTADTIMKTLSYYKENSKYQLALEFLDFARENDSNLPGIDASLIKYETNYCYLKIGQSYYSSNKIEEGNNALLQALKPLNRNDQKLAEKLLSVVNSEKEKIGYINTVALVSDIVSKVNIAPKSNNSARDSIMFFANQSLKQNKINEGITRFEKTFALVPGDKTKSTIINSTIKHTKTLNEQDKLNLVSLVQQSFGKDVALQRIEIEVFFAQVKKYLLAGNASEALNLFKGRNWEVQDKKYEIFEEHVKKASKMVFVPAGNGVDAFYIDPYEVKIEDWSTYGFDCVEQHSPKENNSSLQHTEFNTNMPITSISWHQAKCYADNTGKRLPSVKEWEKVWGERSYPWGDQFSAVMTNTREYKSGQPLTVNSSAVQNDKSPFKVYGLAGNVAEFTSNVIPDADNKLRALVKGGSFIFNNVKKDNVRKIKANVRSSDVGFRCVLDISPKI